MGAGVPGPTDPRWSGAVSADGQGVRPPEASLMRNAITMNAMRTATAIEVTGRMAQEPTLTVRSMAE